MKLPNGPQTPALVQIMQWIASPMSFMEDCADRYGDIFKVWLSSKLGPVIFVSNPQALQEILTGDTKQFEAPGDLNLILEPWVGKNSVLTISGSQHQRQRILSSLSLNAF